jgi:uncharacterized protein (TIGR03435 family)
MRTAAVIAVLLAGCCYRGSAQAGPQFEVASVKPSAGGKGMMDGIPRMEGGPGTKDPGRVSFRDSAVVDLIMRAYEVKPIQISGPAWVTSISFRSVSDRFDIDAKVPAGTTQEQFRSMLQSLLAERFGLKVHRETRQGPVYSLVATKGGTKLKEAPPVVDTEADLQDEKLGTKGQDGFPIMPPAYSGMFVHVDGSGTRLKFLRRSMPEFSEWLWTQVKRPVLDRTELKGRYDFYLEPSRATATGLETDGLPVARDPGGPDYFGAIQSQLGLKLVPDKGEFGMLVIDRVERAPSGN